MIEPPEEIRNTQSRSVGSHVELTDVGLRIPSRLSIPRCPIPVLLAIVVGVFLRVFWLGEKPLWEDEAWTFVTAVSTEPLPDLVGADPHPYSFYWLTRRLPSWSFSSDFAFRLPHAVCSCIALALFPLVVRRLGMEAALLRWCVVVFAWLPLNIRYAQEARAYAFCQLAGMLVLLAYLECLRRPGKSSLLFLFLASAMSMHIDGFGWITPGVVGLHAVIMGLRNTASRRALVAVVAGGLAALPYLALRYHQMFDAGELHVVGSGRLFKAFAARWLEVSPVGVAFDVAPGRFHPIIWCVALVSAMVFALGAMTNVWRESDRRRWLPTMLLVVPLIGLLSMSMVSGQILIFKKYLIPLAPAFAILFPIGLIRISRGSSIAGILVLAVVPLVVSVAANMRSGDRADWRDLYRQMRSSISDSDLFVQQRHLNYPMYSFGPLCAYAWRNGKPLDESHLIEFAESAEGGEKSARALRAPHQNRTTNDGVSLIDTVARSGSDHVWTVTTNWMADDRMIDLSGVAERVDEFRARGARAVRWRLETRAVD